MNKPSLAQRAFSTSTWSMGGYWTIQAIRIGCHLILARLLLPKDFGLSQLIDVFTQGMLMMLDFGTGVNIIQHKRGEEVDFLRTVWTLEIVRGFLLWLLTFPLAYPIAAIYDAPAIIWLLPFAGTSLLLISFTSTNYFAQYRKMNIGRITVIEIISMTIGSGIMVGCAWVWREVWTLLVAGIVYAFFRAALSHLMLQGPKMGFRLEKEAVREVLHFGKWILVSTFNTFLVSRFDIAIIALYLDQTWLGFYGIASRIINMFMQGVLKLNDSLLIPYYAHLKNEPTSQKRHKVFKVRAAIIASSLPIFFALAIWGQQLVDLVYPENFHEVGAVLRVLAIGGAIQVTTASMTPILLAYGDSFRHMLTQLSHAILLIGPMIIGGHFFGNQGLILAIILSPLFNYPILALNVKRYDVWLPLLDFTAFLLCACVAFTFLRGLTVLS